MGCGCWSEGDREIIGGDEGHSELVDAGCRLATRVEYNVRLIGDASIRRQNLIPLEIKILLAHQFLPPMVISHCKQRV